MCVSIYTHTTVNINTKYHTTFLMSKATVQPIMLRIGDYTEQAYAHQ